MKRYDAIRTSSEANKNAWENGRFDRPEPDLSEDEELAWLVAVLTCDGSVFYASSKEYVATLHCIDQEFKNRFTEILEDRGLTVSEYVKEKNNKPMYQVRAHSQVFYNWWEDLTVEDKKELARSYPESFVRGCYDSEGGLCQLEDRNYWKLNISNEHEWLVKLCKKLIDKNIDVEFNGPYERESCYSIELNGDSVIDFCEWVDSTITRKTIEGYERRD